MGMTVFAQICVHAPCSQSSVEDTRFLELELRKVVSHRMGAGIKLSPPEEQPALLTAVLSLAPGNRFLPFLKKVKIMFWDAWNYQTFKCVHVQKHLFWSTATHVYVWLLPTHRGRGEQL